MKIPVPTIEKTSKDKVGDLTPVEAFYTARCGCVLGKRKRIGPSLGPAMTYKFSGEDLGFDYDVLVRTANELANFQYRADKIIGEEVKKTSEGEEQLIIYEVKRLPKNAQAKVFEAMKIDWEPESWFSKIVSYFKKPPY